VPVPPRTTRDTGPSALQPTITAYQHQPEQQRTPGPAPGTTHILICYSYRVAGLLAVVLGSHLLEQVPSGAGLLLRVDPVEHALVADVVRGRLRELACGEEHEQRRCRREHGALGIGVQEVEEVAAEQKRGKEREGHRLHAPEAEGLLEEEPGEADEDPAVEEQRPAVRHQRWGALLGRKDKGRDGADGPSGLEDIVHDGQVDVDCRDGHAQRRTEPSEEAEQRRRVGVACVHESCSSCSKGSGNCKGGSVYVDASTVFVINDERSKLSSVHRVRIPSVRR